MYEEISQYLEYIEMEKDEKVIEIANTGQIFANHCNFEALETEKG